MATTDRPDAASADAASAAASALGEATLAHLVAPAGGDALAAAGLLARACGDAGVAYHVSTVRTAADIDDRLAGTDETATPIVLGAGADGAVALDPAGPVSPLAYEAAAALGGDPDPVTALAGVIAAGSVPSQATPGLLETAALERGPGIATPTTDIVDGLAHTGLAHATFSGDPAAAREALDDVGLAGCAMDSIDDGEARRAASVLALAAAGAPDAPARAATAVERAVRPYRTDGPFATLAGYADVLGALAERAPGLAVALTVGQNGREAALDTWRDHALAVHPAVREAEPARYSGVLVARTDGPVAAVARLLRDYRSPEPAVLAVGPGQAAAASLDAAVDAPLAAAAEAAGGSSLGRGTHGFATFDADRTERFVDAFREAR